MGLTSTCGFTDISISNVICGCVYMFMGVWRFLDGGGFACGCTWVCGFAFF